MNLFLLVLLIGTLLLCTVEGSNSLAPSKMDRLFQERGGIRRRQKIRRRNCQSPSNQSNQNNKIINQNESISSTTPSSTTSEASPTGDTTPDSYNGGTNGGSGQTFSGDGTYFTPGLGACGKTNTDDDLIAAINAPQYGTYANPNTAPVCGRCALVKGSLGQVKVTITDKCPPCKYGDLDLSPAAFQEIGDMEEGRIPITWSFVDC